jgi:hypothetical protein
MNCAMPRAPARLTAKELPFDLLFAPILVGS